MLAGALVGGGLLGSSASVASKFSSSCRATEVPEYDGEVREATVYLFTTPLDEALGGTLKNMEEKEFHHWALVFHFEGDGSVRTLEANEDDGNLRPFYSKERPRKDGKYYRLGKIYTSPKKLRTLAVNHESNGKPYIPTLNNCQEWVKGMANKLGETIASNIKKYKSLLEASPAFSLIVGVSSVPFHFSSKVCNNASKISKGE